MEITVAGQTWVFVGSLLVGAALGLVFDLLRITRMAVTLPSPIVFVEDMVFWIFAALTTFGYFMITIDGQVRFFALLGEGLGWLFYSLTLGSLLMASAAALIRLCKRVGRWLRRWIIQPIVRFLRWLAHPWVLLGRRGVAYVKKEQAAARFRLKERRLIVYNLRKNSSRAKFRLWKRKKRGETNGETEKT